MSLAQAELLYEQYKGRSIHNPIVYRLVLLIHLRKKREKMMEFEMQAMAHADKEKGQYLESMVGAYRRLLFPGVPDPKDEWIEQAKKLLAEETKKVYLIKPYGEGAKRSFMNALKSENPTLRDWAKEEMRKQHVQRQSLQARGRPKTPPRPGSTRM